jgi:WD40 repeat protein
MVLTHGAAVSSLAVLADGGLVSGDLDGKIKIWPRDGRGEPMVLSRGSPVYSLAVPDGGLVSGGGDGQIKIWPRDGRGEPLVLSQGKGNPVYSLAALADGRLASAGDDRIRLWPKEDTGTPVVLSQGSTVFSLAVLPDGRLAGGGGDGTIKLWVVEEQQLIAALCLRAGRNLTNAEWARYIGPDIPWQPSCGDLPSNWRTPD